MNMIARISLLFCILVCSGCDSATKPQYEAPPKVNISTIAQLKSHCHSTSLTLTQDLTIEGIVTANDLRGEYPKAIVLQDASGGIEIAIEGRALADLFPLNARISVYCNGLALGDYGGKIQLGAPPTGDYPIDRIPSEKLATHLRVLEVNSQLRRATLLTFNQVSQQHIDTYVRFEELHFASPGSAWCDIDPATEQLVTTERTVIDTQGRTFIIRTDRHSQYAAEPVPQGTGSINGIIDYFNGVYSLRVTNFETDFPY